MDEAKAEGVRLVQINPPGESFELQNVHRMPPTLVIKPRKDSLIMEEEIFGPVLAVLTYQRIDEAIDFVNSRPRPLGFYYFGEDEAEERQVLDKTVSGGVTVNDLMGHVNCESMPFGGVGASGMGAYHGLTGFRTFQPRSGNLSAGPCAGSGIAIPSAFQRDRPPDPGERYLTLGCKDAKGTLSMVPICSCSDGRPPHNNVNRCTFGGEVPKRSSVEAVPGAKP